MKTIIAALAALLSLAACSHTSPHTPPQAICDFEIYPLETPLPDETPLASIISGNPGDMLVLSGGSQDGAFGAGFLDGWHASGTMPTFRLVTGISTGGLQSTGAFIGRPGITVEGYTIGREEDLLEPFVSGSPIEDGFDFQSGTTFVKKGAISDLIPLRARLDELLTDDVLEAVANRYDPATASDGRRSYLLVGATDVDFGRAVAFDMTHMAWKFREARGNPPLRARFKACYIEALVASSIVPPGARPAFIDNRMYIDGGVRYAVFDDRIGEALKAMPVGEVAVEREPAAPVPALEPRAAPQAARLFMILNHDGLSRPDCNKIDEANCTPPGSRLGQREDWDPLSLLTRTLGLFEQQVRRLSVERVAERASRQGRPLFFARIRAADVADASRPYAIPDFEGDLSCREWRALDDADENPIEFHKRYMRCLIEYGRERGASADWDFQPRS